MFQVRQGKVSYNLRRDVVNLFRDIARAACYRLGQSAWHPAIREWAAQTGLTEADLTEGAQALAKYVNVVTMAGATTIQDAWQLSGLDRIKPPTLMALLFELGGGLMATFFEASRESQPTGYVHPNDPAVAALAEQMGHALTSSSDRVRKRRVGQVKNDLLE